MRSSVPPRLLTYTALVVAVAILTGCTTLKRNPVPIEYMSRAEIPGMPHVRDWGDASSHWFQEDLIQSVHDSRSIATTKDTAMSILVLSGGGSNGAFGAGYLCGWSETGTRPEFKLVTGISTGALAAPFAFLGSEYDETLEEIFTTVTTKDIYRIRNPITVMRKDSLTRTDPLASRLEELVDQAMLDAIAEEHRRGRRLFVATTNLDAQRLVVWNMGAIAAADRPDSLELFRKVLLASASIPVAFPPVYIDVEIDGVRYDEMHVDGGVIAQFFLWGAMLDISAAAQEIWGDAEQRPSTSLYIIRNSQIEAAAKQVERNLIDIASRSMITLLKAVAMGDLIRVWALAQRDNVDFNYVGIPPEHKESTAVAFKPVEMRRLFDLGHTLATGPEPWQTDAPTFVRGKSVAPPGL